MERELSSSAQKVQDAVRALGYDIHIVEMPGSTRTSVEAAEAVGCDTAQIAKSLIFRLAKSDRPLLVIASGSNRVDEKKLKKLTGEKVKKADADFVRQATGYAIGGIPPVGHLQNILTLIDEDLLRFEEIWAAAGTPHALFPLSPAQLVDMTGGQTAPVRVEPKPPKADA